MVSPAAQLEQDEAGAASHDEQAGAAVSQLEQAGAASHDEQAGAGAASQLEQAGAASHDEQAGAGASHAGAGASQLEHDETGAASQLEQLDSTTTGSQLETVEQLETVGQAVATTHVDLHFDFLRNSPASVWATEVTANTVKAHNNIRLIGFLHGLRVSHNRTDGEPLIPARFSSLRRLGGKGGLFRLGGMFRKRNCGKSPFNLHALIAWENSLIDLF